MDSDCYRDGGRLLADIGGTNARFAIERAPGRIEAIATLACAGHAEDDFVRMTNYHWQFSIVDARDALGLETLLVVNDFAALAAAVPGLGAGDVMAVGAGQARAGGVVGLVGAGTGLGVAGLIPAGSRWTVLESEGGHVSFSPCDVREEEILRFCRSRHDHVSAERLVSGSGLSLIHEALAALRELPVPMPLSAATIVERGLSGLDPLCLETLECFCAMLGTVASNLAVTLCARGGIYIGGVVPRLGGWFAGSPFRARFESKGRFSGFTAQIPTLVITAPNPALSGAATLLAEHLADARGVQLLPQLEPQLPRPAALNTERSHASL